MLQNSTSNKVRLGNVCVILPESLFPVKHLNVALTKEEQKIVFQVLIYVSEANGKLLEDNASITKTVFLPQNHQDKVKFRWFRRPSGEIPIQRKRVDQREQ